MDAFHARRRAAAFASALVLGLAAGAAAEDPAPAEPVKPGPAGVVEAGRRVTIEYTLKLDDGSVVDSNVGKKPLEYEQGSGKILPGLEKALVGMKVGESRSIDLTAAEGYGELDPEAFRTVPLDSLPEDARKVGTRVGARNEAGKRRRMRVHKIEGEEAVLDLNHPLAGKALHFDVKILAVE